MSCNWNWNFDILGAKFLSNIKRPFSGCECELLFKTIMKEVQFHKNIILARSKVSFSVKTGCVFLPDNLEVRFLTFIDYICPILLKIRPNALSFFKNEKKEHKHLDLYWGVFHKINQTNYHFFFKKDRNLASASIF